MYSTSLLQKKICARCKYYHPLIREFNFQRVWISHSVFFSPLLTKIKSTAKAYFDSFQWGKERLHWNMWGWTVIPSVENKRNQHKMLKYIHVHAYIVPGPDCGRHLDVMITWKGSIWTIHIYVVKLVKHKSPRKSAGE